MENVVLGGAIIGIINVVQKQFPQVSGVYAVALAVVLGIIAGYIGFYGATIETGILTALASSGAYKLAQKAGGQ